eukprot:sb/3468140/
MFRLAVKTSTWHPTAGEWLRAANTITPTERERVGRYMFKRDAKHAMIGRLLVRHCLSTITSQPPDSFVLDRDESGKPYLSTPSLPSLHFNVSHAGDYAVCVCNNSGWKVGVDVMKVELRRNTTLETFFSHMKKQFTPFEWDTINGDTNSLFSFYRHWCLKESYVKTIGTGLKFGLQRIEFHLGGPLDQNGGLCETTTVLIDGVRQVDWVFEESSHDGHITAIAIRVPSSTWEEGGSGELRVLKFSDLSVSGVELGDRDYFNVFNAKKEFPG